MHLHGGGAGIHQAVLHRKLEVFTRIETHRAVGALLRHRLGNFADQLALLRGGREDGGETQHGERGGAQNALNSHDVPHRSDRAARLDS